MIDMSSKAAARDVLIWGVLAMILLTVNLMVGCIDDESEKQEDGPDDLQLTIPCYNNTTTIRVYDANIEGEYGPFVLQFEFTVNGTYNVDISKEYTWNETYFVTNATEIHNITVPVPNGNKYLELWVELDWRESDRIEAFLITTDPQRRE